MKSIIKYSIILLIILIASCGNKQDIDNIYLEKTDKRLTFPIDEDTKLSILALFPFTDKDGKEYLTFQNERRNEILFYEMNSGNYLYKLQPEYEGPDGVGNILGYYIKSMDDIFLTAKSQPKIVHIGKNGKIKEWIDYEKTSNGSPLNTFNSISYIYTPIIMINEDMYILSDCNRFEKENPVSAVINMNNKSIEALPFKYPLFPVSENKNAASSVESYLSRCYDGNNFVYSFHFDEYIYVASLDHKSIRKVQAKSKYIPKVEYPDDNEQFGGDLIKKICENPNYGNLYFDKYRNVYYRIAYPKDELDTNENFSEIWHFGRKKFSIIILNKDFNVIGETLMPDFIYNSTLIFIKEDGLYISDSHYKNPSFNEDKLSFACFKLVYK